MCLFVSVYVCECVCEFVCIPGGPTELFVITSTTGICSDVWWMVILKLDCCYSERPADEVVAAKFLSYYVCGP